MSSKKEKLSESKIIKTLDWLYDKAVDGVPGLDSASEMAEDYMKCDSSKINQTNSLIRWQNTKAGTSGFLMGVGGILTMPIMIPANISSVMYIQIRMVAAIAHMGGHNLRDDRVKALVYACLAGNAAKDILKDAGVVMGMKLTTSAIKTISGKTLTTINQAVGFRLFTKFGNEGIINLGKTVPFVGGIVGLTLDSVTTNTIGNIARRTFVEVE